MSFGLLYIYLLLLLVCVCQGSHCRVREQLCGTGAHSPSILYRSWGLNSKSQACAAHTFTWWAVLTAEVWPFVNLTIEVVCVFCYHLCPLSFWGYFFPTIKYIFLSCSFCLVLLIYFTIIWFFSINLQLSILL